MKRRLTDVMKWGLLVVFLLTAGVCYSCGSEKDVISLETPEQTERDESRQEREASDIYYVHVCGEVVNPGVYQLLEGQRIYEAIELAGGFTEEACEDFLNQAEPVCDGMKVLVPGKAEVKRQQEEAAAIQAAQASQAKKKVNLNTATVEELMTLRGIGQARAEDIIRHRQERGGYSRIEDIMEVSGIKEVGFEKIKDDIAV